MEQQAESITVIFFPKIKRPASLAATRQSRSFHEYFSMQCPSRSLLVQISLLVQKTDRADLTLERMVFQNALGCQLRPNEWQHCSTVIGCNAVPASGSSAQFGGGSRRGRAGLQRCDGQYTTKAYDGSMPPMLAPHVGLV